MRLLMVGLGKIAWRGFPNPAIETHLNAIIPFGAFEIVGGVDPSGPAREDFARRICVSTFSTMQEALDTTNPQAVVVCSPMECHMDDVIEAANHRSVRGILCEKPMAESVEACAAMIDACRGKVLLIGHQRRYDSRHLTLRNVLKSDMMGRILAAKAHFHGDYLNNGTHAADLCRMMVGDDVPWTIRQESTGFGVTIAGENGSITLNSDGILAPGYLREMYLDFYDCIEHPDVIPRCSGEDGCEAVRAALSAGESANAA